MEGDREAAVHEKNETSGPTKATMSVKDWVTVVLSVFAFGISAIGLYVNLLRQTDDLRVVIDDIPEVNYSTEEGKDLPWIVIPAYPLQFTFINAGNRAAAVRSASIVIAQGKSADTPRLKKCRDGDVGSIDGVDWDIKPFVLKPNDIFVVDMKFKDKTFSGRELNRDVYRVGMDWSQKSRKQYMFAVCLRFNVVTPDNNSEIIDLPVLSVEFNTTDKRSWDTEPYNLTKPLELVSRVGFGLR
jgi:hypothetical protein